MKLIIVESPAKSRTIEKFLGPGYTVAASYGHIRDLPGSAAEVPEAYKKEPWARLGVNPDDDFAPIYVISSDSKKHVAELKKLLKGAEELLLATDEDREGEAISWHILEVLAPKIPVRRITFHEITKDAIRKALESPRDVNENVVRAQESRRILDRLFGYQLSPVLWKKVRTKLSAGRVQSVALRLVVEREEERLAFVTSSYWDLEAAFQSAEQPFTARLHEVGGKRVAQGKDFDGDTGLLKNPDKLVHLDEARAQTLRVGLEAATPWTVTRVERKEARKRPAPPLITSTLQQAASSRLGMTPRRTMQVAQRLYEGVELGGGERTGLITYMRTDSVTLSGEALGAAERLIRETWGPEYTDGPRFYRTKAKAAQEAHEAIRPTDLFRRPEQAAKYLEREEAALYRLIWERAVASQMTDAVVDRTAGDLTARPADGESCLFRANGSVVRFPGFLKVSGGDRDESVLPALAEGDRLPSAGSSDKAPAYLDSLSAEGHETAPPPRYNEASLIKKLEEAGIGRPSTYAPTISTIIARDYVLKKKGGLVPTFVGMAVVHLLRDHFPHYVDVTFTAHMEDDLDLIASGEVDWKVFLHGFYHGEDDQIGLLKEITDRLPDIDYPAIPVGEDPETGAPLTVRIGRTNAYIQSGEGDDARRATLPVDLLIDELTPEKAQELLLTRERSRDPIGTDPETGEHIYVMTGPFGPYLQLGEVSDDAPKPKRVSIGKGTDAASVDLEFALRLLSLPREVGVDPETGKKIKAGLGRFGPYVECNRIYASVEDVNALFTVTVDEALERIRNKNKKPVLKDLGPHPETGVDVQVVKGRYGAYVTDGTANATLRGIDDPTTLTMEQALPLLAEASQRKGKKTTRKKTATKKTTKKTTTKKKTTKKKTTKKKTVKKATTKKTAKKKV